MNLENEIESRRPAPVVLVTGGAQRVGAQIVRMFHARGFDVVIHYSRSQGAATALQTELSAIRPGSVSCIRADLLDPQSPHAIISQVHAQKQRLDVLVNNASTFYPTPIGTISEAQWLDLLGSNVKAPLFLTQEAVPLLRQTRGNVINITDIHAERSLKYHSVYCLAKAALVHLTKSLAKELGPEIRVNAVSPGAILWPENATDEAKTTIIERTVLRRQGTAADIAGAVTFLACDAPYVTGQVLAVDGGRTLFS